MEPITLKKRLQVISLYLSGLSFDQISAKTGVSKGSVTNIITELKAGNFPEAADLSDQIETLRELAVDLAKLKLTAGQSAVGIAILRRIYELKLDPADMERWPLLLNSIKTQDDAQELIEVAYAIRSIQQESGLSLPALEEKVKKLGEKVKELETVTAKIGEAKNQLNDLIKKREVLTVEVSSLEDRFKWLTPRVQELEQREKLLLNRHESMLIEADKAEEILRTLKMEMKKLQKAGLSVEALVDFNRKLETVTKRHGIKASMVRERLLRELKYLNKGLGIETLVNNQQQLLKENKQTIRKCNTEIVSLEAVLDNLRQQKQNLEASIEEVTTSVRLEIEHIVPVAQDTVKQITEDLKSGCAEALSQVHRLKEESIRVGQDIGQYEGILKESEWVKRLMTLLHGGDNLDATDVRTIALLVNSRITAWLGQHGAKSPTIELLALTSDEYVRKLAQWETKG